MGENRVDLCLKRKATNQYSGKMVSILGDSISTFEGYNPYGYKVFYSEDKCKIANLKDYKDTWWGIVLEFFGAKLLVNNSWSGSRVSKLPNNERLFPSGCSDERTTSLHISNIMPDVILVYLGTNDWANGVEIFDSQRENSGNRNLQITLEFADDRYFDIAYEKMIEKIKTKYPKAEIWCFTLSETFISNNPGFRFPHEYAGQHIEKYNEIIRRIAKNKECKLIDLYNKKKPYDSIDGSHPSKEGMQTIASSVCYEMSKSADGDLLKMNKDDESVKIDFVDTYIRCNTIEQNEKESGLKERVESIIEEYLIGKLMGDNYILQEIYGGGCMTRVYVVTDSFNKKIGIKVIIKDYKINKSYYNALCSEINFLKNLEHPYIRTVFELIEDETCFYIIWEYVEGTSLELLARKAGGILPVKKVIRYALQIAEALQYLHSQNPMIYYANIVPSNIVIDYDDNVKLFEFYDAREYPNNYDFSGYSPPEKFNGMTSPKSDIYTLGMVMHRLLTGVNPSEPPYEINPIRQYNRSYTKGLEKIIKKCICVKQENRYSGCLKLIADLNQECSKSDKISILKKWINK